MIKVKDSYLKQKGGDREFVELLMLVMDHGLDAVEMACALAVEQNTLRLPAIINLVNQLVEPAVDAAPETHTYPRLTIPPEANCKRYEMLYADRVTVVEVAA